MISQTNKHDTAESVSAPTGLNRRWTIFIVQHSHIDIGYTEKQELTAAQHAQFIRQAVELALSPRQKTRDEASRFKFTCEGFWQVEQFLARATAEERRNLVRALKSGVMELSASRLHFTELLDQELLRRSLQPAVQFARQEGIPLQMAMHCDINGLSWGMADALAEVGVRWLSMNINPHHGGNPLGKPNVPFYWETPSGKRILAWNGMSYHKANLFGLMGGPTPDCDPGVPGFDSSGSWTYTDVQDITFAERKLLPFLRWLETSGYPDDFLPLMGSGLYTDNSPPSELYCRIIQEWNAKYGAAVHLRSATQAEFFEHLERHATNLPVHRGEWTDWWSDGVASTPQDTLVFRNAQRTRHLLDLLDPESRAVAPKRRAAIDDKLMLYAEHTFGHSHPALSSLLPQQVFLRKTKHAVDADGLASSALYDVLRTRGEGEFTDQRPLDYTVLNPLQTPVRSVAYLPLDFWEAPTVQAGYRVVDDTGRCYPQQTEGSPRGWTVAVPVELAPGEQRRLKLVAPGEPNAAETPVGEAFENEWYQAAWSQDKGIVSLTDRATGAQVLDPAQGGLGSPLYQIFLGGAGARTQGGRGWRLRGTVKRPQDEVTAGQCTAIQRVATGPVYERWEFHYQVPGATAYALVATFFHELPQIELTARLLKTDGRDPEGMYVLFPFAVPGGVWHWDKPGALIRPGLDQLPQSCTDYYLLQHGAALAGKKCGVAWATLDAPLVQLGQLRLWTYSMGIEPTGPLYSWLTNNKWETNFRLSCGGAYNFRYIVQVGRAFAEAEQAAAQARSLSYPPLVMRK